MNGYEILMNLEINDVYVVMYWWDVECDLDFTYNLLHIQMIMPKYKKMLIEILY